MIAATLKYHSLQSWSVSVKLKVEEIREGKWREALEEGLKVVGDLSVIVA